MGDFFEWCFELVNGHIQLYNSDVWGTYLHTLGYFGDMGWTVVAISFIASIIFYYWPSAKMHGRIKWIIMMFFSYIVSIVALRIESSYLFKGMHVTDSKENLYMLEELMDKIVPADFWGIGICSIFLCTMVYIIVSFVFMHFSTHNWRVPIKK